MGVYLYIYIYIYIYMCIILAKCVHRYIHTISYVCAYKKACVCECVSDSIMAWAVRDTNELAEPVWVCPESYQAIVSSSDCRYLDTGKYEDPLKAWVYVCLTPLIWYGVVGSLGHRPPGYTSLSYFRILASSGDQFRSHWLTGCMIGLHDRSPY